MKRIIRNHALITVLLTVICITGGCSEDSTAPEGDHSPGLPRNPTPADGATACDTILALSWQCSDQDGDDLSFTVYIQPEGGPEKNFNSPGMSLQLEDTLKAGTGYTWHVVAGDASHSTTGPDWTFTTCADSEMPPGQPGNPSPAHQSSGQPTGVNLSWTCSDPNLGDALTYDVYFGKTSPPPPVSPGQSGTGYNPGALETSTTYYWKVVATDRTDRSTPGPEWSFTTLSGSTEEGVFAILVAGRSLIYYSPALTRMDALTARFDSAFAPCDPIEAVHPGGVSCNEYTLEWENPPGHYVYERAMPPFDFLQPGETYTFEVDASAEVPALTKSIVFPQCEPYITSPANFSGVSRSGFTATWEGYSCGGQVRLIIIESAGDTTGVNIMTDNDGSYTFTQQQLSGITGPQNNCSLIMILQHSDAIDAPGYDSRSYIWGRTINTTMINFTD